MTEDDRAWDEDLDDCTLYRDLFSGKINKITIGVVPGSTTLWRKDEWTPKLGEGYFDKLPGNGVYEVHHDDFVSICKGISKERICTHEDKEKCKKYGWHPTPEEVARGIYTLFVGCFVYCIHHLFTKQW